MKKRILVTPGGFVTLVAMFVCLTAYFRLAEHRPFSEVVALIAVNFILFVVVEGFERWLAARSRRSSIGSPEK